MKKRLKQEPTLKDLAIFFILILIVSMTALGLLTIAFLLSKEG